MIKNTPWITWRVSFLWIFIVYFINYTTIGIKILHNAKKYEHL